VLVGRAPERIRIDGLLSAARSGSSGLLVLHGEAGIGKSALLAYARERAADMQQLRMHGLEIETDLAFAGLTELLRPVMRDIASLPAPQAEAIRSALALDAEPANALMVRVAVLTLLALLADAAPVLISVDDGQWVDQSSMEVLLFAARRLTAERVALVIAVRSDDPVAGVDSALQLKVAALPDDEARTLLAECSRLSGAAADQLVRIAAGNPLALCELPEVVGENPVADDVVPVPVGPRVQQAFRRRLERLPDASRLALGVVAADGVAGLREILTACDTLGLSRDALQPAEDAGLVVVDADRVLVRHPLFRSVAYHALSPPQRRAVHRALATALDRSSEAERRTWHRAAAVVGPDEEVARALEVTARAAQQRSALPTAAHGFSRAAQLSGDDDDRARRLLSAASVWSAAAHWDFALRQLDEAGGCASDPGLQADVAALSGLLEAYRDGPERADVILGEAANRIQGEDPARATRLLTYAVNVAVFAADVDRAVAAANRAAACGDRAGGLSAVAGALARVEAGLLAGDPVVPMTLAPLAELADVLIESDLEHGEHLFSLVVLAEFVVESWERAERLLDLMVRRARRTGRLFLLAFASAIRAELAWRRGAWNDAYVTATTDAWETPNRLPVVGSWLHAVQARIEAGLGLYDDAAEHGRAALAAAIETKTHAVAAWAGASLGFLELGRGRPLAAIEHLERVAATLDAGKVREPGILWWAADLIEAHWRVGDIGAARRRLEVFAAQADVTGRLWAKATAARAAGLLASSSHDMEAAFSESLDWHRKLDAPFEQARTLLRLGERRLTFGRNDAERPLRTALETFARLGAEPWAAEARRLLGDQHAPARPDLLTRQERQVALIVGRGATNREAADELFLSPRTIDFHLRNIYKKLRIRSRAELAARMAPRDPAATSAEAFRATLPR
jgi:DNA-binding CsgD family transcriptional regulator